jgi:hypothetical protein
MTGPLGHTTVIVFTDNFSAGVTCPRKLLQPEI